MIKKIILLGYMGCGKSTIGKQLSIETTIPFVDLDTFIEKKEEKSITEIFKTKGEIYFRKKESLYLKELLENNANQIIALGGGTPCFGYNMDIINAATSYVFYLHLPAKTLIKRLKTQKNKRPLISHLQNDEDWEEFINKHLFERLPFYRKAHHLINCENLSVENIVQLLKNKLES